jgi:hypothetical protein
MNKSIRSFVLVAVLAFTVAPALNAEQTGTNPHPQVTPTVAVSVWETIVYTVQIYVGL